LIFRFAGKLLAALAKAAGSRDTEAMKFLRFIVIGVSTGVSLSFLDHEPI
jgi:hypothetical protein